MCAKKADPVGSASNTEKQEKNNYVDSWDYYITPSDPGQEKSAEKTQKVIDLLGTSGYNDSTNTERTQQRNERRNNNERPQTTAAMGRTF